MKKILVDNVTLEELNFDFKINIANSRPTLLSNDYRAFLLFLYDSKDMEKLQQTYGQVWDSGVAVFEFAGIESFQFGAPNDEALGGHRYVNLDLGPWRIYEVHNSEWIQELEQMNNVHPRHNKDVYYKFKHFIFSFKESTFECVTMGYKIFLHGDMMGDIILEYSKKLTEHP